MKTVTTLTALLALTATTRAALPPPPTALTDFPESYASAAPGPFAISPPKPAGKAGPVIARNGHFYTSLDSPARLRFLGVNFCFSACFPTHDQADLLAPRLAAFGINIVRFHHMDNQPFPSGIFQDKSLATLDPVALDRLDYFINALKQAGIYTDLNLHVSRSYAKASKMPGSDTAPSMDKLIDLFTPALIDAQKTYATALLTHVNLYTKNAYTNEPAVAMIEITNEDTFFIWGGQKNLDALPEPFARELRTQWTAWLKTKYGSRDAIAAAWTAPNATPPLGDDEQLDDNSIALGTSDLHPTPARAHDWYDFLQRADERYFSDMYRFLRQELRVHSPVTGTIGLGALGTLSQTHTDFIDAHQYWQHPTFPRREWDLADWTIKNSPMVDSPTLGILPDLAAIRVAGKPFTVTEYQEPAPNEYRAEALPLAATFAALQDWDALFVFAYSHNTDYFKTHPQTFFDIEGDPVHMNLMPVAARLFTSGMIAPLPSAPPVYVSREESLQNAKRFYFNLWPQLTTLHNAKPQSLLYHQFAINFTTNVNHQSLVIDGRPLAWTTTGLGTGQFAFTDPQAAVYVGFPPKDADLHLGPLTLSHIQTPFLVATLTPQKTGDDMLSRMSREYPDPNSLASAKTLLLTLNARTTNKDAQWNPTRTSVGTHWGTTPQLETISATLALPSSYTLTPLDPAGQPLSPALPSPIDLSNHPTMWYRLDKTP
jgi:hypothetical protein